MLFSTPLALPLYYSSYAVLVDPLIPPLCGCLEEVRVSAVRSAAIEAMGAMVPLAGVDARGRMEAALQALVAREPSTVVKAAAQRLLGKLGDNVVAMTE